MSRRAPTRRRPDASDPARSTSRARLAALEAAVRARTALVPEVGIVLGSGLGGLADDLDDAVAIPFDELPGWPAATAPGHVGRLLLGTLGGRPVVMLQGRFHLYEGNDPGLVIQPVLLFQRARRARIVVLTNAAGGLDPSFGPGTLMVMTRPHQPDRAEPAHRPERRRARAALPRPDRRLEPAAADRAARGGRGGGRRARRGHLRRPDRADLRDARPRSGCSPALGGHAVGMSTVLECIAARWVGPRGLRRVAGDERRAPATAASRASRVSAGRDAGLSRIRRARPGASAPSRRPVALALGGRGDLPRTTGRRLRCSCAGRHSDAATG